MHSTDCHGPLAETIAACPDHVTTGDYAVAQGGKVGQEDEALLEEGLAWAEVGGLEEAHRTSPEEDETSMDSMSTEELAGEVCEACVTGPPRVLGTKERPS